MRDPSRVLQTLARVRVPLGFACGVTAWLLATPSRGSLLVGGLVALLGEALRIWAAGHLTKAVEVTTSGPYRWFAHPLYVGSTIIGAGLAIASERVAVAVLVALYLSVTIGAAIRTEEASLRARFGERYTTYKSSPGASDASRTFRLSRVVANREYRAAVGWVGAALLLWLKAAYNGAF